MGESERTHALLTDKQRIHLAGDTSDAAVRMAHSRARKRLYEGITTDASLIFDALADETLEAEGVLNEGVDPHGIGTDKLANGLVDTVSIVYLLAKAAKLKPDRIVQDGIAQGKETAEGKRVEALYQTYLKSPGELTINDLNLLIDKGKIDKQRQNNALDRIIEWSDQNGDGGHGYT